MPVVSDEVSGILFTVSSYLFPFLAVLLVAFALIWLLSESAERRATVRNLPGSGTVGELIVLSGSKELPENTWFPVPREGVLGSVRSCDLVIPCPGVRSRHLDFSWHDGQGLMILPRSGCEVYINGSPVTVRTGVSGSPLCHGSVLQVGSAVLRLHLFAALDHIAMAGSETGFSSFPEGGGDACMPPPCPVPMPVSADFDPSAPMNQPEISSPVSQPMTSASIVQPEQLPPRSYQADRWKEDFGE